MKPYPKYKPSGVPWLGDVPEHWEVKKAKYAVTCNDDVLPEDFDENTEIAYVEISDVEEGVGIKGWAEMPFKEAPSRARRKVQDGDIIISTVRTYLKAIASVENPPANLVVSTGFAVLRPHAISQGFAKYAFAESGFINTVLARSTGVSYPAINATDLVRIPIPIPGEEQEVIAAYLDNETARIDTLVTQKEKLLGLLSEARMNTITGLITGAELPGEPSGNPWVPHLPKGWQVKRLKHLAEVRSGLTKGKDYGGRLTVEMPYLRVANVQDGHLNLSDISMIEVAADEAERFLLQSGDVLMNEGGDFDKLGRGAVWSGEVSPCLHQNHVFAVRPYEEDVSEWLAATTQTMNAKFYFKSNAKQSTNLASISQTDIKELPVLLPPPEERLQLLSQLRTEVSKIDGLITHVKKEIELLKELRSATITDAVLGRIDLREYVKKAKRGEKSGELQPAL